MNDHHSKNEVEMKLLYEEYKKNPQLFETKSYVEDSKFLRQFGILIPGKENAPSIYLKLYPSDFIVEEISNDNIVYTISGDNQVIPNKHTGKHTFFATLVKCNLSTLEAIQDISLQTGCEIKDIHYAGLKDKNAITAQRISIHNVTTEDLKKISSPYYFLKDIEIGKGSIEKSKLSGNRFTITLRTKDKLDKDSVSKNIDLIQKNGFYNYYYLQRFGTPRFMSHLLGFDILRGNYEKVIKDYITTISDYEIGFISNLRKEMRSAWPDMNKIKKIASSMSLTLATENKIIDHLIKQPSDYIGALKQVPDQTLIWVYALASLLFNETLSSYCIRNTEPPKIIPLLLSNNPYDIKFYEKMLTSIKYYPPQFNNLLPFPNIRLQHRTVETKEKITIDSFKIIPEGAVIRFSLNKGAYATTALSHIFNLISGPPDSELPRNKIDSNKIISGVESNEILSKFEKIDQPRNDHSFE